MLNDPCCTSGIGEAFFHVGVLAIFPSAFTQQVLIGQKYCIWFSEGACLTCQHRHTGMEEPPGVGIGVVYKLGDQAHHELLCGFGQVISFLQGPAFSSARGEGCRRPREPFWQHTPDSAPVMLLHLTNGY